MVAPYRAKTETGGADWRCEYWGKWFTSLTLADAYHSTPATRELRDAAAKALMATAAPDGYLGTRVPAHRLEGWDVWGCKYALLGLIADYDRTHDPAALTAARRQTEVLIAELGPGKTEHCRRWGMERLAGLVGVGAGGFGLRTDGREKIPGFCRTHRRLLERCRQNGCPAGMRLVEDALAGKNPDQMCAPKAYEMMSCFEGLCELYRATGKREYLEASVKLADGIFREEATLVGVGTQQ